MDPIDMCEEILEWANSHPNFDTEFVLSVMDWINDGRDATNAQVEALENIMNGFSIG